MKQALVNSLKKSLLPQTSLARQALQEIISLSNKQTILPLMEIVIDNSLQLPLRMASLVQLKTSVQNRWKHNPIFKSKNINFLSLNQKQILKSNLLSFFMNLASQTQFNKLLYFVVSAIVRYEHKCWMPTQQILDLLQRIYQNSDQLERVIQFIMCISSSFENLQKSEVYDSFCFSILPMVQKLMPQATPKIVYLLTKIFWKSTNNHLNNYFQQKIKIWMDYLFLVSIQQIPEYHTNTQNIVKFSTQFYYFHSKKWASRCISKSLHSDNSMSSFFVSTHLPKLIEIFAKSLCQSSIPKLRYFTLKVLYYSAIHLPNELEKYRPYLQSTILPAFIKVSKTDFIMASLEPLQFMRKEEDSCWGFVNVRAAAIDLWVKLIRKSNLQESILCISEMIRTKDPMNVQMSISVILKMSYLNNPQIIKIVPQVLQFLKQQFEIGQLLVKCRLLQLISTFPTASYDTLLFQQLLSFIVIMLTTSSNQLLVIRSIESLNSLINNYPNALTLLKPYVNNIIKQLLNLLSLPSSQDIVPSIYQLIINFKTEVVDHLVQLINYFAQQFLKFSEEYNQAQVQDGVYNGRMEDAAVGCLNTVETLLELVSEQNLQMVQKSIILIVEECFTEGGLQYYQDGLNLLNIYVYKKRNLSRSILFFYPLIFYKMIGIPVDFNYENIQTVLPRQKDIFQNIKTNYSIQYIQKSVPVLRNYIYKCSSFTLSSKDYFNNRILDLILELVKKIHVQSKISTSLDCIQMMSLYSLLIYILQNSDEQPVVCQMIKYVYSNSTELTQEANKYLRKMHCQLWCMCAYRYPEFMMQHFSPKLILKGAMDCTNQYQKKRVIICLCVFLGTSSMFRDCPNIQVYLLDLLKTIVNLLENKNNQSEDSSSEDLDFSQKMDCNFVSRFSQLDESLHVNRLFQLILRYNPELNPQISGFAKLPYLRTFSERS